MNEKHYPSRVLDIELYWVNSPLFLSQRCLHWLRRFEEGWVRNRRVTALGYYCSAEFFGVYIWEYLHILYPVLSAYSGMKDESFRFDLETGQIR